MGRFVLFVLYLVGSLFTSALSSEVEEFVARVQLTDSATTLSRLIENNFNIDHHPHNGGEYTEVYGPKEEIERLSSLGFTYDIIESEARRVHMEHARARSTRAVATYNPLADTPRYYNYADLDAFLQDVNKNRCPNITQTFSIGKTLQNREILGIQFSDNPKDNEAEPEFKYIGNIHGDEVVGRMNLIYYIDYLCTHYGGADAVGQRVTRLVDSAHIYIVPSLNPDGSERATRSNTRGVDLNRDFPDQFTSNSNTPTGRQKETQAMMAWTAGRHFVLSASFHGGAVVANYAYDGNAAIVSGRYSGSPDDKVYKDLALTYSTKHTWMSRSDEFADGITNGAAWYVLYGGMQDWNYLWYGCLELTIEISNVKYPQAATLPVYWNENLEAMLVYNELVFTMGIRGVVTNEQGEPLDATVTVADLHWVHTDPEHGDYYKIVQAGSYRVTAAAAGYTSLVHTVIVPLVQTEQVRLDFKLKKV